MAGSAGLPVTKRLLVILSSTLPDEDNTFDSFSAQSCSQSKAQVVASSDMAP